MSNQNSTETKVEGNDTVVHYLGSTIINTETKSSAVTSKNVENNHKSQLKSVNSTITSNKTTETIVKKFVVNGYEVTITHYDRLKNLSITENVDDNSEKSVKNSSVVTDTNLQQNEMSFQQKLNFVSTETNNNKTKKETIPCSNKVDNNVNCGTSKPVKAASTVAEIIKKFEKNARDEARRTTDEAVVRTDL